MNRQKPELIYESNINISCSTYREVMSQVMKKLIDYVQRETGLMSIETPSLKINPLAYKVPIIVKTLIAIPRSNMIQFYRATIALHIDHTLEIAITDDEEKETKLFIQVYCNEKQEKVMVTRMYFDNIDEAHMIEKELYIDKDNYEVIKRIIGKMLISIVTEVETRKQKREENEEERFKKEVDNMLRCYL